MQVTAQLISDEFSHKVTSQLIDWIQMFGPFDLKTTLSYGMVPDWEVCLQKSYNLRSLTLWLVRNKKPPFDQIQAGRMGVSEEWGAEEHIQHDE